MNNLCVCVCERAITKECDGCWLHFGRFWIECLRSQLAVVAFASVKSFSKRPPGEVRASDVVCSVK